MFQGELHNFVSPPATELPVSVEEVDAVAGRGLAGDRYFLETGTFTKPGEPELEGCTRPLQHCCEMWAGRRPSKPADTASPGGDLAAGQAAADASGERGPGRRGTISRPERSASVSRKSPGKRGRCR